jgi:hypothetical protein
MHAFAGQIEQVCRLTRLPLRADELQSEPLFREFIPPPFARGVAVADGCILAVGPARDVQARRRDSVDIGRLLVFDGGSRARAPSQSLRCLPAEAKVRDRLGYQPTTGAATWRARAWR